MKLFVRTLGCAMNVKDSEHFISQLKDDYELCDSPNDADLVLINTCSVREKPVQKLFSELGALHRDMKSGAKLGVCGCTASHLGEAIIKRAPYVSFVLGARNVSLIREAVVTPRFVRTSIENDETNFEFENSYSSNPYKSYINIMVGCDKKCTYCIVPHTRGDELSVPKSIILAEANKVAESGAKEICLLGQNVNNYGKRFSSEQEKIDFSDLLCELCEIKGIERIRFTSPHPLHMDDKFLEVFSTQPKICKSIHMPLQSGSTAILKAMKRGYSKEWFLNRASRLRELCGDKLSISTDIIVAFPGESDADFKDTMDVIEKVRFEQIFSFKYSPRPLTPAANMEQIEPKIASERLSHLQSRHNEILDDITNAKVGEVMSVYFDELRAGGKAAGRSDNNFAVAVTGSEELLGKVCDVRITSAQRMLLSGELA